MFRYYINILILLPFVTLFAADAPSINYSVPEWSKHVVWYQIFPERFCNGDYGNDPQFHDIFGSWPHDTTSAWHLSNWTGDWYALEKWENDGQGFFHHVQRRRYGGDIQGIIDKLDYLQDLGITAIYLNPMFESPSLHKYDASTYHHIDDNFGPDPFGDRERITHETPDDPSTWVMTSADSLFFVLVRDCHQRNIKVIIDGVWNHVGMTFWAFRDVVKNQQNSRFKDWFIIKSWDDPATPGNEFDYKGWWDVRELPEFAEDSTGFAPALWDYISHSVSKWMDPNHDGDPSDGIDGWRLDVAAEVGFPFWRKFRNLVRTLNPESYLTGEIWFDDNIDKWLQGDVFDAVMNYRFASSCVRFFIDDAPDRKLSPTAFDAGLREVRNEYPEQVNYAVQNLLDSHDTDRLASMIINNNRDYGWHHKVEENPNYQVRKPTPAERQIQKLIVLMQMTYVGAPMIYYGDEAGMWGASDPDERKPMLWPDMQYAPEASHPLGLERPVDENRFDMDLYNYYKKLVHIRDDHQALQTGTFTTLLTDDQHELYAFARQNDSEKIIVVLNNSSAPQTVQLDLTGVTGEDLLTGGRFDLGGPLPLNAKQGYLFYIH